MDNHSFPDDIHVFVAQHPDNDTNAEDMPELVSLDAHGSQPQQQTTTDVEISDHDSPDSESSRDAYEVEMQTVDDRSLSDHAVPNPTPTSHTALDHPAVNNRRARVEDDEDEDRDRRHPSQRIGNSANAASSAGPSSSTPLSSSQPQLPTPPPQATLGARFRGQAPIFTRTVVDEAATGPRNHPFRFFQHLMSNNNNSNDSNDAGNINSVPSSGAPAPAQPHQDGNTPDNQPHGRIETFSVTLDIGLGPAFTMGGGGAQPHEGQASGNPADPNFNANPNDAQNPNIQGINIADFMARLSQAIGGGDNAEGIATAPTDDNPAQGPGAAGATPGAQFGFNIPGGINLANLAGLGFGFNFDGSGFGEKEDPERARKLVDGLEEVPVGLVKRLERIGGTGGGMGEDETKGGDGGCAICWDRLLGSVEESVHQHQGCEKNEEESEGSQPETSMRTNEASNPTPKIVSLPCAHVFHAECLIPWFSRPRQTTCPTCRFNIDPENLTYVSWRRRMRERRERERAEARARDPENADGDEAGQDGIAPPTVAAEPIVAPLPDTTLAPEQVLSFLSRPFVSVRSQTPDASVPSVRPTPAPRSSSQPPASSSSSLLSDPAPPTSQLTSQTHVEEGETDWDVMPGLEDASNSDSDDDDEDNDDEDEDEDEEDGDGAQEEGNGIQGPPILPHLNEPPTTAPGAQAQAPTPRPRQNDPFAPRTIQTAHGLITFIPVPFNFPFPTAGNGVGVGVQAGGNAATANPQVPPAFGHGQGQFPNGNANANVQAALPQGFPLGIGFPHFHVQMPHMPEFGAQRDVPAPAPAPPNAATNNNANANLNQAVPTSPFVNAQEAAAITHTEEHLMQHLRSQGFTTDDAENIRRASLAGRQADLLRRGENPAGAHLEMEEEEEDMMDIDEGMGMVVDLTMNQAGVDGGDGAETGADAAGMMAQDGQNRPEFNHVLNFFNNAVRQAQRQAQAQAGFQTQGQAQQPGRGTQEGTPSDQNAPQQPSQQQQQPQQQQGQGFVPPNFGNFNLEDDRTINDFVARMFANLGGPQQQQQQAPQQGPQAHRQNDQPPPQAQAQPEPQAGQEPAGPNPANANANNNGGRPRQAQFAFSNVTFGPFTNLGSLFGQAPNGAGAGQERVKKAWTLPPAPGPTLRQRIERRERDAGLRCYDISCGVGPSDEDPIVSEETIATGLRQLMIMNKNRGVDGMSGVCMHTFHPGCLVSAERVALGGADVNVIEGGGVEVSCPVCRSAGCVTRQEWDEGILALS